MALDFANLQSAVASAIEPATTPTPSSTSTAVAEPPASPAPASAPPSTPASPTAPTPPETPAPQAEEDDFSWDGVDKPEPAAETPVVPEAPKPETPATDDPANWKPEDIQKMLPQEVIGKMLQTQKGRNIYQSYIKDRELSKPAAEGGIGFTPTVEQIREMYQDSSDFQMMVHEFQMAHMNPAYAQNWTKQWLPVGQDGRPAPYAMTWAQQLAPTLDQHSPDLYRAVAVPFVKNYVEELYRQADGEQDPEQRVVRFNVARILEQDITGKAREIPEEVWKGGKQLQPQADPQNQEIAQKLRRIEEFERGQQSQAANAFVARLNGGIRSAVTKDIQYALKPIAEANKGADGKPNRAYQALEAQFHNDVVKQVTAPTNQAQLRSYTIARDRARATGDPTDIENAARAWTAAARPIIAQLRKEYLKDAIAAKTAESTQRHQVLDEASQKRGSTSIGQPTEKNVVSNLTRQPGETHEEWMRRRVENALAVA